MIFGLFPEDFDEIELGAVGRQIQGQKAMLGQPAVGDGRIDVVMHRSIVHDQKGPLVVRGGLRQLIEKANDVLAPDGVLTNLEVQLPPGIVQSAHDVGPLATVAGIGGMRASQGRPAALDIGEAGKSRFIEVEQFEFAVFGRASNQGHGFLDSPEEQFVPLFFKESRLRLKDKPRAFRPTDRRSRLKLGASGKRSATRAAILPSVSGSCRAISAATSSISAVSFTGAPPL